MHDIIVVSDLHLGRGKNPETGRYHRLEAFFFDDDFEAFCRWLCERAEQRKTDFKLVLNGDTFDLLRIDPGAPKDASARERRYGPVMTPAKAAETVGNILAGHPMFANGIAHVLATGYSVVMLPGNHDMELQWEPVQQCVYEGIMSRVRERGGDAAAEKARQLLTFEAWFHYEPGRIWIEHGNQYDSDNSFGYNLRSGLTEIPDAVLEAERDIPMGTFFQRYLYNQFGAITFIVPSARANSRYFRWLLLNRPRLLARVAFSHFPFFMQIIRRIAKSGGSDEELAAEHEKELAKLSETSQLGDKLRKIDNLKARHGTAAKVARGIILRVLKVISLAMLLAILVAGLWFLGFHGINELDGGFGLKAVLFIALNFVFLSTTAIVVGYLLLRPPSGPPARPARNAAEKISRIVDVPIVTFGHTHDEVVWRLGGDDETKAWYHNTGTWVSVFTHDQLMPRERVQYTFLRVRGENAELLHWSPGRWDSIPVVLLEDDSLGEPERPSDVKAS